MEYQERVSVSVSGTGVSVCGTEFGGIRGSGSGSESDLSFRLSGRGRCAIFILWRHSWSHVAPKLHEVLYDLFYCVVRHVLVGVLSQEEGLGPVKDRLERWHASSKNLQKVYLRHRGQSDCAIVVLHLVV